MIGRGFRSQKERNGVFGRGRKGFEDLGDVGGRERGKMRFLFIFFSVLFCWFGLGIFCFFLGVWKGVWTRAGMGWMDRVDWGGRMGGRGVLVRSCFCDMERMEERNGEEGVFDV